MRLPRRSPFETSKRAQLLSVYRHLYPNSPLLATLPDAAQLDAHPSTSAPDPSRALSLVQLWMNRSSCPYAVESTASLVQATLLDQHMQQIALSHPTTSSSSSPLERMGGGAELGIRMNYTMAITRFVNSIVDSYQSGNFAQPIAAIALRIGLPHWFVELRHAGTHEDLPSLDVCREATRAALDWLHRNFWIPSLFSRQQQQESGSEAQVTASQQAVADATTSIVSVKAEPSEEEQRKERQEALEQLNSLLRSYKKLGKAIARDQSLAGRQRAEVVKAFKAIQTWTSARMMTGGGASKLIASRMGRKRTREEIEEQSSWADDSNGYDEELVRAANRDLVDALLRPGGLVPLAKSKRVRASIHGDDVALPQELEETWAPLVAYLRANLGLPFVSALIEELIGSLAYSAPEAPAKSSGGLAARAETVDWREEAWAQPSYRRTAFAWLRHLIGDEGQQLMTEDVSESHSGAARTLEMAVIEQCLRLPSEGTISVLRFMCDVNDKLVDRIAPLLAMLESSVGLGMGDLMTKARGEADADTDADAEPEGEAAAGSGPRSDADADAEMKPAEASQPETGFESDLAEMEMRLQEYRALSARVEAARLKAEAQTGRLDASAAVTAAGSEREASDGLPAGWSRATSGWRPTPIGCFEGAVPTLSLAF